MRLVRALGPLAIAMVVGCSSAAPGDGTAASEQETERGDDAGDVLQRVDKEHPLVAADGTCRYVPPGLVSIDASGRRVQGGSFQLRDVVQGSARAHDRRRARGSEGAAPGPVGVPVLRAAGVDLRALAG